MVVKAKPTCSNVFVRHFVICTTLIDVLTCNAR